MRHLAAALLAAACLLPMTLHAATPAQPYPLVVTLDTGPSLASTPRMTPQQRHEAILRALADHGATVVLFVTLNFGANHPEGRAMARRWGQAGHLLGNHTVSHPDLHADQVLLAQYLAEIDACDAALHGVPGRRRWFSATFLNEDHTAERRDGLRRHLAARGYALPRVNLESARWLGATLAALHNEGFVFVHPDQASLNWS